MRDRRGAWRNAALLVGSLWLLVASGVADARTPSVTSHRWVPPPGCVPCHHWWTNVTAKAGTGPGVRNGSASAYDVALGFGLVFGGLGANGTPLGDSWVFQHGVWTRLNLSVQPSARAFSSMVYDGRDHELLLFGGSSAWPPTNASKLNDTWAFGAGGWSLLTPSSAPMPRFAASMAYDQRDRVVLLFGGNTTLGPYADTWSFAAGTWHRILGKQPTPRSSAAMTYDQTLRLVVMTNGKGLPTRGPWLDNDTWTFSGGVWKYVFTSSLDVKPVYRLGAAMASGPLTGPNVTVLVGGSACPTCHPTNRIPRGPGKFDQAFFYAGGLRWITDYNRTPALALNSQFPVFFWDDVAHHFVYFVQGLTYELN